MFNNFDSSILRAKGDAKYPLFISIFSGILNVVLNLFFVIAIPLGVVGVATATVILNYISAVCVAVLLVPVVNIYSVIYTENYQKKKAIRTQVHIKSAPL